MILSKYTKKQESLHAIDINPEAIKTVDMNKNILGLQDRVKAHLGDIKELAEMPDDKLSAYLSFHK